MQNSNTRIIFLLPQDTNLVDIIYDILRDNGLRETQEEAVNKSIQGEDSKSNIIRDAALTLVQKKISEEKIIELLAKHLEISADVAKNIVKDINEKLVPFARTVNAMNMVQESDTTQNSEKMSDENQKTEPEEKKEITEPEYDKEAYKNDLLQKITSHVNISVAPVQEKEASSAPYLKTVSIEDVDKNAENLKTQRRPIISQNPAKEPLATPKPQTTQNDKYKEPIG